VPAGAPEPGAVATTAAVNVTLCPNTDGLADELTNVVVLALLTVWLWADDVLPAKLAEPT
jgi:hypothetical protein